jgi:hypothetical protein
MFVLLYELSDMTKTFFITTDNFYSSIIGKDS